MGGGFSVPPELPLHSSTLYNGKVLEPLFAANEKQVKLFQSGVWSEDVPERLRTIILDRGRYRRAIATINTVSKENVWFKAYWQLFITANLVTIFMMIPALFIMFIDPSSSYGDIPPVVIAGVVIGIVLTLLLKFFVLLWGVKLRIMRRLKKAIGKANVLLFGEKILMGTESNSRLLLVHVCLDGCRQDLSALSQDQQLFHKYIEEYSNAYVCCLNRRYFPFKPVSNTGHLPGAVCFCQFVLRQLHMKKCCFCCRNQNSYSTLKAEEYNCSSV